MESQSGEAPCRSTLPFSRRYEDDFKDVSRRISFRGVIFSQWAARDRYPSELERDLRDILDFYAELNGEGQECCVVLCLELSARVAFHFRHEPSPRRKIQQQGAPVHCWSLTKEREKQKKVEPSLGKYRSQCRDSRSQDEGGTRPPEKGKVEGRGTLHTPRRPIAESLTSGSHSLPCNPIRSGIARNGKDLTNTLCVRVLCAISLLVDVSFPGKKTQEGRASSHL